MEPVQTGEYLPAVRPADPQAKKPEGGGYVTDPDTLFDGWYSDSGKTAAYDFAAPVTADGVVYAAWKNAAGERLYTLRILSVRHTSDGLKTATDTYLHSAGTDFAHELENYSGYAGPDTVCGTMPAHDVTVEIHFYKLGDVNCDGSVTAADAALALRFEAGLVQLDDTQQALADVDESGDVDSDDALRILQFTVGIRDSV